MKPLLTGAVLTALSPLALANGTEPSSDWLGLDEELNAVASPVALQGGGVSLGVLFRGAYVSTGMDDFAGFGADQLGMTVDDVELWHEGSIEQYSWRVSVDFGTAQSPYYIGNLLSGSIANTSRTDTLEDAYVDWHLDERFSLRLGHFIFPTSFASETDPGSTLFMDRSTSGEFYHAYDLGAMLSGDYDVFEWAIGILNGTDGTGDEHATALRGVYNLGDGANGEGARGAADEFAASIGVSYVEDGAIDDSETITIDALGSVGQFGFGGEFVTYGDAHGGTGPFAASSGLSYDAGEGPTVFSVFGSFLINENWEAAVRFEDFDDNGETTAISFGVNFYQAGDNAKWQLLYKDVASDVASNEGSIIAVGITVGASRNS